MKALILSLLALVTVAQPHATHVVLSSRTSTTSDKVTVAQNQTTPLLLEFTEAVILSTVDGTVKVENAGAAATTTASAPRPTNPGGSASAALGYSASDVGTGTTISVTYKLTANVPLTLDMRNIKISGIGTTKNVTVVVALDSTGDVQTAVYFRELN